MLIRARSTAGEGVAVTLNGDDDLNVGRDVVLISTRNAAIIATGQNQKLTVAGTVSSGDLSAFFLDHFGSEPSRIIVTIEETGLVTAGVTGIGVNRQDATVVNHGHIVARFGIVLNYVTSVSVVNTGKIAGVFKGVIFNPSSGPGGVFSTARTLLDNSGRITAGEVSFTGNLGGPDLVRNSGFMSGDILLGGGNDVYAGRGGKVVGTILGGEGNDRFAPGAAIDVIDGGDGTDTLDFRFGGAVRLALDRAFAGTGSAKGDSYAGIENINGSARGNDILRGDAGANALSGFGGNDRLTGAGGNDTLSGGAGRDRMTGGLGDDFFDFTRPRNGGDRIIDYSRVAGNDDHIRVDASGFGVERLLAFEAAPGFAAAQFFRSGRTNQAQDRNDLFLFRTGDETLWFDRDGTGRARPVLIADFADGVRLTAEDIALF